MQFLTHELIDIYNECETAFPGDGASVMQALILKQIADNLEEIADALNKEGDGSE